MRSMMRVCRFVGRRARRGLKTMSGNMRGAVFVMYDDVCLGVLGLEMYVVGYVVVNIVLRVNKMR